MACEEKAALEETITKTEAERDSLAEKLTEAEFQMEEHRTLWETEKAAMQQEIKVLHEANQGRKMCRPWFDTLDLTGLNRVSVCKPRS